MEEGKPVEVLPPANNLIVDWTGDDDPDNPLNWPSKRKGIIIALLSCLTFVT